MQKGPVISRKIEPALLPPCAALTPARSAMSRPESSHPAADWSRQDPDTVSPGEQAASEHRCGQALQMLWKDPRPDFSGTHQEPCPRRKAGNRSVSDTVLHPAKTHQHGNRRILREPVREQGNGGAQDRSELRIKTGQRAFSRWGAFCSDH